MKVTLNRIQKTRLLQAFFAVIFLLLSYTFISTFDLPEAPSADNFLSGADLLRYNLLQLIFLVAFISAGMFLGMAYQAKDMRRDT